MCVCKCKNMQNINFLPWQKRNFFHTVRFSVISVCVHVCVCVCTCQIQNVHVAFVWCVYVFCVCVCAFVCCVCTHPTHTQSKNTINLSTGWRRLIGSPKLQIIFHKRATKYRSLLRKMTYEDKGSYESSPPCTTQTICIVCKHIIHKKNVLALVEDVDLFL